MKHTWLVLLSIAGSLGILGAGICAAKHRRGRYGR